MDQIIADSIIGAKDSADSLYQREQALLEKYKLVIIAVTLLALVLLAVVAALTLNLPPFKKAPLRSKTAAPITTPTPTLLPAPTPPATPSALILSSLSVQILNASGVPRQAASVSALLQSAGFTRIQTGNTSQSVSRTLVVLSPAAATAAGDFVSRLLLPLFPNLSTQQNSQAQYDLTVIIGRNTP